MKKLSARRPGPFARCPRCRAVYATFLVEDGVEHDHKCPPRWEARDPWGELIVATGKPTDEWPNAKLFYGVDPAEAAERAVEWLVDRGEVAETCEVEVEKVHPPDGAVFRVRVRVEWSLYEGEHRGLGFEVDEIETEISAERLWIVPAHERVA